MPPGRSFQTEMEDRPSQESTQDTVFTLSFSFWPEHSPSFVVKRESMTATEAGILM